MHTDAGSRRIESKEHVQVLIAHADDQVRSSLAARMLEEMKAAVLEALDGSEAVRLAHQRRPRIALLDVDTPSLGGVEVALTLRGLEPTMRVALQTTDPRRHRDDACIHGLPLFDALEPERALTWLGAQVHACAQGRLQSRVRRRRPLECSACRYGIVCSNPPACCPMCRAEGTWMRTSRRLREGW